MALGLRYHAPLLWLAVVFALFALATSLVTGDTAQVDFLSLAGIFVIFILPAFLVCVLVWRFAVMAIRVRPQRPAAWLLSDLKRIFLAPYRLVAAVPVVVAMTVFMNAYTVTKANIPRLVPFAFDGLFRDIDRIVHGGVDPWRLVQPLLGIPAVTYAVNVGYNLWFFVMWTVWTLAAFHHRPRAVDMRFLVAFMLTWLIGGGVLAIALSSAGPAFFDALGLLPDPYAELMAYLAGVNETWPVYALNLQDKLWAGHLGEQDTIVGISAMPSMHNASTLLFVLWARTGAPRLVWPLTAFAGLVYVGSVHLAWHYAIDAYLGWAAAGLCWWLAGRVVARPRHAACRARLARAIASL